MNDDRYVRMAIESGEQEWLDSALNTACYIGDLDHVRRLLQNGANINNKDGMPIYQACINRRKDVATLLIERGVDLDSARITGFINGLKDDSPVTPECWEIVDMIKWQTFGITL